MATMFNICTVCQGSACLVRPQSPSLNLKSNSSGAVTLKAISLAVSATAELTLLLTMKLKWNTIKGFIISTCLWTSSSIILFTLVGVIAQQPPPTTPPQTWRYTQNYYYGIFAAGLHILIAGLLTLYAGSVHNVHLSPKDRTSVEDTSIVLRALTLVIFLLGGAAIYVPIEGWSLPDALYWAVYTILTVGIGNIVPKTHLGRSLLFPYATAGITSLGLFVSSIASFSVNLSKARQIKTNYHRRRRWLVFLFSLGAWFLLWLVSARIFKSSERTQGWTYFDSLYFTFVSLTTIGYGDLYPSSNFGKSFFVFWALLAVPVMTAMVGVMGQVGFRAVVYFVSGMGEMWPWGRCGRWVRGVLRERRLDVPVRVSWGLGGIDVQSQGKYPEVDYPAASERAIQHADLSDSQLGPVRRIESARHNLLLCEEIENLVSILRSDIGEADLHREWVRVVPLLVIKDEEHDPSEPVLSAERHQHPHVDEMMFPNQSATDRNKEVL
ncbi:potassium channel family protein [Aspergillus ibericus CBS 121593]|uniref:Potassium channel domain-containing protein n=1 Tax=Aspergillus ibericus CBS 121593 TaxID=1448316 RepID=A0A395GZ40_9EURO|nr:hypothetical protein BO80DRAFT_494392 [Aspergillus ibericus CBS 121593]RAK99947.1 hypothetical protein BO80DRAFT_494392 [Aspergillus ibericus CBS 121593]